MLNVLRHLILSYMYNISNMGANMQRAIKNELSHGKIYFPRCVVLEVFKADDVFINFYFTDDDCGISPLFYPLLPLISLA